MTFATFLLALLCMAMAVALLSAASVSRQQAGTLRRLNTALGGQAEISVTQSKNARFDFAGLIPERLRRRLFQAGVEKMEQTMLLFMGTMVLLFLIVLLFGGLVPAIGIAVLQSLCGFAVLDHAARRRMLELSAAMRAFLERVRQNLIAGNSFPVALERAAQSSPPIVQNLFAPPVRRIANGASVAESITQMADELDVRELHLFSAAVNANMRFGGSLTAVLQSLIESIRNGAMLDREVRVSTSQVRASAWVLGLLPVLVATLVTFDNPDYVEWFLVDPVGQTCFYFCLISQTIGILLMRKIIRAKA